MPAIAQETNLTSFDGLPASSISAFREMLTRILIVKQQTQGLWLLTADARLGEQLLLCSGQHGWQGPCVLLLRPQQHCRL